LRSESVHYILHDGDRERHIRFPMDRRQGFFRNRVCQHHGRMSFIRGIAGWLLVAMIAFIPCVSATEIPMTERRSGATFMLADTQAMQNEDTANPGMLWVLDGEALWKAKAGSANRACSDCHGNVQTSMRGVATRYPAFDEMMGKPVDLEQRVKL